MSVFGLFVPNVSEVLATDLALQFIAILFVAETQRSLTYYQASLVNNTDSSYILQ